MPASTRTILRHNPYRSPKKKIGLCGVCGEEVTADTLFLQRGVLISRRHYGCVDNPNVFEGQLQRGPHYGGT